MSDDKPPAVACVILTRVALAFAVLVAALPGVVLAATTVTPDARPTAADSAAVHRVLRGDFQDVAKTEHHQLKFAVGHADLNGDGLPDLIVLYDDVGFCGSGGCTGYALLATQHGYAGKAIYLANFHERVTVLDPMHHGMHDLRFDDATYVFRWTGRAYR